MNSYSQESIKQAFWDTFHKSGELWFDYLSDNEEHCEKDTQYYWTMFLQNLHNPNQPEKAGP